MMQKLNQKQLISALLLALIAMFVLPNIIEHYTLSLLLIYSILAMSLGLIWGFGGILCFGQAAYFGLGAYSYAVFAVNMGESSIPFILAILTPAIFAAILGAIMFYGRLSDVYLGVITLVVTLILYRFINATAGSQYTIGKARLGGFNGMPNFQTLNVPGFPDQYIWDMDFYYLCFVITVIVFIAIFIFTRSSFGRISIAIGQNEQRMELIGYDIRKYKTILFAIGGGLAGLAGALYASWAEIVTPSLFSLGQSAEIIIWCIVGGLGSLSGPILGAVLLGLLKYYLGQQSLIDNNLILGFILVMFVLFLPNGIAPAISQAWNSMFKPKRSRHKNRMRRTNPTPQKEELL